MEDRVIITGAGPIGLALANLLCEAGIDTVLIEAKKERKMFSKAIGITPPTLQILSKCGIDKTLIENGVKIKEAFIHGSKKLLGRVSFDKLKKPYNYIISIPQYDTENILEKNLEKYDNLTYYRGVEVVSIEQTLKNVQVECIEIATQKEMSLKGAFLIACDGGKSFIRSQTNLEFTGSRYKQTFLMGDFNDTTTFDDQVHIYLTKSGSVETFPLPGKKRRWVVETPLFMDEPEKEYLIKTVSGRTGVKLSIDDQLSESPFGVQHHMIEKFYRGRFYFAGDAAHLMSPIGGQGMNSGIGDVDFLSVLLQTVINNNVSEGYRFNQSEVYNKYRKFAVSQATKRAELSMNVGTFNGFWKSLIRNIFLCVVLHSPLKNLFAIIYSMNNIRFKTVSEIKKNDKLFFKCDNRKKTEH